MKTKRPFTSALALGIAFFGAFAAFATEYVNGILVEYYGNVGWWLQGMPDLDSRAPDLTVIGSEIDHPASSEVWDGLSSNFANHFAARHRALLEVPSDGTYVFTLTADDGAILVLDGEEVIVDDVPHGMRGASCSVELTAGLHEIQVDYFEEAGDAGLVLEWQGPGVVSGPIPPSAYFLDVEDGFGFGLSAEVFDMRERSALISDIPDLRGLAPCETGVVESVYFPASAQAWATFPQDRTDYYAARFTGWIKVDADGGHVFSLSADDGARLWIDGALAVDNGGRHSSVEVTNAVSLTAGLHRIRIEYLEMNGNAGLELRWSGPGFGKTVVPPDHLLHDLADPDSDADGIPDSWEISYGLDPDDPSDAQSDPDGDGATCLQEHAAGTNPVRCTLSESVSASGLKLELYSFPGYTLSAVPDFGGLAPDSVTLATNVCFGANELSAALDPFFGRGAFAARFSGYIRIPVSGRYDFRLRSDDGSVLWIDGERLVDCDGLHGARDAVGSRWFESGDYPVVVGYFDNGGSNELTLYWTGPGIAESPVPSSAFRRIDETVNRPLVSLETPESGRVFGVGNVIRIAASAYAYEGVVTEVDFFAGTDLIGRGSLVGGRWTLTWTNDCRLGEFPLSAVAVDSLGRRGVSTPVGLTVLPPPSGYSYGIDAEFYEFDRELLTLPELDGLHPSRTFRVSDVNYGKSLLAWTGFPESPSDRFAVRFSGNVWVRESGRYVLTVTSDDGAELRLDGTTLFEAGPLHDMQSRSVTVELSKGIHPFELRCYENDEYAGAVFAWTRADSSSEAEPIPEVCFVRQTGVVDSDGDGTPDWWEEDNGFDPADPADAGLDADADGLTNLAEYRFGTNPRSADTDADGMPDAWEVANGTIPFGVDALDDPDGDGLANVDEYRAGSRPDVSDTDGDGFGDRIEFNELGTDATVADSIVTGSPETTASLTNAFSLVVNTVGVYAVSVTIAQEWHDYGSWKVAMPSYDRVLFAVDGHEYAWRDIGIDVDRPTTVVFYTPILGEGEHWVSVGCGHPEYRLTTVVVSLSAARCLDLDLEGVARRRNRVWEDSIASRVSPAFVEGDARFPWRVSADVGTVRPSGSGSWYMDVPLDDGGSSAVTLCFEDMVSTNILVRWEPTNPFADDEPVLMRAGSRLLLAGCPDGSTNGTVRVETNGVFACDYEGTGSAVLSFPEGDFDVVSYWECDGGEEEGRTASFHVRALGGTFAAERPACLVGVVRRWGCPRLPEDCVLEADERTLIGRTESGALSLAVLDTRGERMVTARISEGGPVLDCRKVEPLWAVAACGNIAYAIETNEYGTLCRSVLSQRGAAADVRFKIESYLASVLLDDFTTHRMIGIDSFDAAGHYTYDLIKPDSVPSPCHSVFVYQGAEMIGEAVYGDGPMPEEWK